MNSIKMRNLTNHKPYILFVCLIWTVSFFGEILKLQPFSTIGIIISPPLTLFGIYKWFISYKIRRGHYPNFLKVWRTINKEIQSNPFFGTKFILEHILETWTFIIICWMCMFLIMFLTFRESNAFNTLKEYCENNPEIIKKTGKIKYYGVLVGGEMSNDWNNEGNAEFTFTIVGENGNFNADAYLIKHNNTWKVIKIKIH